MSLVLAGCGSGSTNQNMVSPATGSASSASSSVATPVPQVSPTPATAFTVSGTLTFDSVPPTSDGLNYAAITQKPIRAAVVELLNPSGEVVSQTTSDTNGHYSFAFNAPPVVSVRVLSQTQSPPMTVQDNTNGNAIYSMASPTMNATAQATLNLNANAGGFVAGVGYTGPRVAAPFAVLDACYSAASQVLALRPDIVLPPLPINWSINNRPLGPGAERNTYTGDIGTSYYQGGQLFIVGKENVDTDEYDSHVVVHEWGHYFEDKAARSDSIGGPHGTADILDPRVAFGEGYGNALSGIILYPNSMYIDTLGPFQASVGVNFDLQDATDPTPGWYSEVSVQTILYRVFAPPTASFANLGLGLRPILDVLTGPQKSTPALTTIFSFINGLQNLGYATHAQTDPLLAQFSMQPITDDFGRGQTADGGISTALPVFNALTVNGNTFTSVTTSNTEQGNYNKLPAVRYFTFTGDGSIFSLEVKNGASLYYLVVLANGQEVLAQTPSTDDETFPISTKVGQPYVFVVDQFGSSTVNPTVQIRLTSGS